MKVNIKLVDGLTQEYEFDGTKTIQQLKEYLTEQTGIQPEQFGLIFRGKTVSNDAIVETILDSPNAPPFFMIAQLRGGFF